MSAVISLFLNVTVSLPKVSFAKVRRYTLADALNAIPEMTVEVFGMDPDLDMADLVGQAASVHLDEPAVPSFDGIVRHVEQRSLDTAGVSIYTLTIAPRPWLTTERGGHRIFQDRTALEIVSDVLAPYGDAMDKPEGVILQHVLPTYEYRVQCGETDHDFLFRILSEHGLSSYWSPDAKGQRRWIVTDDLSAGNADIEVPYRPASGALAATGPHVSSAAVHARLCSSEARLRDYDYRKPAFRLEQRCIAGDVVEAEDALNRYSFAVGRFEDDEDGGVLAARRLEQARSKSRTYRWEASFAMRPGMRIRLHDHPRDDANGDFLVVSAWTEVDSQARKHVAEVVPAQLRWRPEVLPKPRIHGTQTAFVVGAPGKEIDVDKKGRLSVHFHWDTRKGGASRRLRVAMPWTGTNRGFWTSPRVGDEVLVAYLDGDPDQPLVVGSVNNAVSPPATPLPRYETQSWWRSKSSPDGDGYNAILMEDAKGAEALAMYAERDFFSRTGRRAHTVVGENQILEISGSQSVTVGGGQSTGAGNVSTTVGGEYKLTAKTITVHSTGDMSLQCDGSRSDLTTAFHTVGAQNLTLTGSTSATLAGGQIGILAAGDGASIKLEVGGSSIEMSADKITIRSPLVEINP